MPASILMVRHARDERGDTAARHLEALGHRLTWVRPDRESLPDDMARFDAAVVYGGPHAFEDARYIRDEVTWAKRWVAADKPWVGFCLGSQILAHALGAAVGPRADGLHEMGFRRLLARDAGHGLFPQPFHVYESHYHGISGLPASAEVLASTEAYPVQAFRHGATRYGFQFHPEVNREVFPGMVAHHEADGFMPKFGVDTRARQEADAALYLAPMEVWLKAFLDDWLARLPQPLCA